MPLVLTGNYLRGERIDKWVGKVNDKLYLEFNYKSGKLNGDWTFYNEDNTLGLKYEYKDDIKIAIHLFNFNVVYKSLFLKDANNQDYKIEQVEYGKNTIERINFTVKSLEKFENYEFIEFFENETNTTTIDATNKYKNKNGPYFYEDLSVIVKGNFSFDKENGAWETKHKKNEIIVKEQFANGELTNVIYTDLNNQFYSGTVELDIGDHFISIKVKDGLRNGWTITKDRNTNKVVSKVKFKDGVNLDK
jgi:hypothetical protein